MSFLVRCPNCGDRSVTEFRFGGERLERPSPDADMDTVSRYLYNRQNESGDQHEWWYHRLGCRRWFIGVRDTKQNIITDSFWTEKATS